MSKRKHNDFNYRYFLKYKMEFLKENLNYEDIVTKVYAEDLITVQEKQDLDAKQVGSITKTEKLLGLLLNKNDEMIEEFVENVLRQTKVFDEVSKSIENMQDGSIQPKWAARLKSSLKRAYNQPAFKVAKLSDENQLDLSDNNDAMIPTSLTHEKLHAQHRTALSPGYRSDKQENILQVKHVLETLKKNKDLNKRLTLCTGIAGVGKSVFLKRLAIGWAADKEFQDIYEEVIHISLKQVDTNKPVPDVLCQCGYIDQSICEEIEMYFRAVNSRTVLFLLDSVDEVNLDHRCDLFKLITGRLYKNVQILFTARTEAPILECGDIQPEAMITLETLTDETVKSYIDKHAADEAGKAVNKHHLFDLTLLNTPLMLTMWVTNSNYDNIPKNGLEILQRFVDQVMRKKVCNTSCKDVDRFQLELGHFCLDLIMQERSSFPVEGLQSYHLSEVELKTSGMFYRSSDGFYTFTHKRLQEYFAALYIADHGLQYTGFLAFLAKAAKQKSSEEPFTLRRLFRGMEFCMVLVAGIKPSIIEEVISKYKKHLCVATGEVRLDGNPVIFTDLAYEAEVMNGMTDNKTKQVMFRFIANAKGCYRKGMGHDMLDYHRVSQALESIPQKLCQSILQEKRIITEKTDQGYRLKQEPESLNGKWKEKSNHSVKGMVIPQLDCVTACLLKRLQLMSVTHLQVDFSLLMDIQVVLSIFPNLEWLSINGEQNDCLSYCATKTINPLKYLQLMGNYTLSTRSVANVLTTVTADLQKLVIFRTNIFEKMAKKDLTNSQYLNLVEVHIFMPRMYEYGSHLQDLIAKCPHLLHLHLQEDTQGLSGGTRGSWDINMCIALLDCLIYNAKKLIHLSVIDLFNVKSVEYLINHCHMKSLRHIGLSKNDLYDILKLDDPVICISNLKVFHYVNIDEELAEKLSNLQMQNTVVTHMIYDEQGLLCPVSDK